MGNAQAVPWMLPQGTSSRGRAGEPRPGLAATRWPRGAPGPPQPCIAFSMWFITWVCSFSGLKRITSASLATRTLWPGGQ